MLSHQPNLPLPCALLHAAEPWEKPAGDLRVQLRYPAWLLKEAAIRSCLQPRPVHLVGSSTDVVAAALAAGSVAGMLRHRREAVEMGAESQEQRADGARAAGTAMAAQDGTVPGDSIPGSNCGQDSSQAPTTVVCLVALHGTAAPSPAAAAMLRVLRRHVPGLETSVVAAGCLLDDEWMELGRADAILVDWPAADGHSAAADVAAPPAAAAAGPAEEAAIAAAQRPLGSSGLLELLWQRFWAGCLLVGVGQGCALLGRGPAGSSGCGSTAVAPPVLPWYRLRAGGGIGGWATLHASLDAGGSADGDTYTNCIAAGVLGGGVWVADPTTGQADMAVAPCRDALVALAAWSSQPGNQPEEAGLEEAAEEHGFMAELAQT